MKNILKRTLCILLMLSLLACIILPTVAEEATEASDTAAEEDPAATVDVVVASKDMKAGVRINNKGLKVIKVKKANLPHNVVSDIKEISGNWTRVEIFEGEYIMASQVSKTKNVVSDEKLLYKPIEKSKDKFVVVTDYIMADTGEDITSHLQTLINKNQGRTIYFPDGEYLISSSLRTMAVPSFSTMLVLSEGAVIKAAETFTSTIIPAPDNWKDSKTNPLSALICIGAGGYANDNRSNGSYYGIVGGTLDGSGKADGVSVDSGRETIIHNVRVINPRVNGIQIKMGANNVSSDADIENVTIIGGASAVGISIVGYDNTITDARIYGCKVGVEVNGGGTAIRGVYVYGNGNTEPIRANCGGNFYFHNVAEGCSSYRFAGNAVNIWNR